MMWKQITVVNTGVEIIIYLNADQISREDIFNHSAVSSDSLNCTIGGKIYIEVLKTLNSLSTVHLIEWHVSFKYCILI